MKSLLDFQLFMWNLRPKGNEHITYSIFSYFEEFESITEE